MSKSPGCPSKEPKGDAQAIWHDPRQRLLVKVLWPRNDPFQRRIVFSAHMDCQLVVKTVMLLQAVPIVASPT